MNIQDFKTVQSLSNHVHRESLQTYLGLPKSTNKSDMLTELANKLHDDSTIAEFCDIFTEETALTSSEVEQALECTPTERIRWTENGNLIVVCERQFYKWGKHLKAPGYSRKQILFEISDCDIASWRELHRVNVQNNRKQGAIVAAETKRVNDAKRSASKIQHGEMLQLWSRSGKDVCVILNLAYWTMWVSRWAKTNELKSRNAKTEQTKLRYESAKQSYYLMKEDAVALLSKSKLASVYSYIPDSPDKIIFLKFCDFHYGQFNEFKNWNGYISAKEYASHCNLKKCPKCKINIEKNYYSLYYVEIVDPVSETKFSFHCPYGIGKEYLPDFLQLPTVSHIENTDSIFRFGRSLTDDELVTHTETRVIKEFNKAIEAASSLFSKGGVDGSF